MSEHIVNHSLPSDLSVLWNTSTRSEGDRDSLPALNLDMTDLSPPDLETPAISQTSEASQEPESSAASPSQPGQSPSTPDSSQADAAHTSCAAIDRICSLNSQLERSKAQLKDRAKRIADKDTEIQKLQAQLQKMEELVAKQKTDIKTLKSQSGNQKKELVTLSKERDDAVREREHNRSAKVYLEGRCEALTETNKILTAKVESLKTQRDCWQPVPLRSKASNTTAAAAHKRPTTSPGRERPVPAAAHRQPTSSPGRERQVPAPRKCKQAEQQKLKLTALGASNLKHCGSRLSNSNVDGTAWVYSGAQMADMPKFLAGNVTKDTDIVALHFGTNDALNAETEGQALLGVKSALEHLEQKMNVPMLVCAVPPTRNSKANDIRQRINEYLAYECSRNHQRMLYVDCGITFADIGSDGIHLKSAAKDKMCKAITAAAVDFTRQQGRPQM